MQKRGSRFSIWENYWKKEKERESHNPTTNSIKNVKLIIFHHERRPIRHHQRKVRKFDGGWVGGIERIPIKSFVGLLIERSNIYI